MYGKEVPAMKCKCWKMAWLC